MRLLRPLQPALAALLAACVLLLGWAAYAPDLHEAICEHGHAHEHAAVDVSASGHSSDTSDASAAPDDASCAVSLFAAGCDLAPAPLLLAEPALNAIRVAHFTEFMLARTLRGPARVCGPPVLA